MASNTLADIPAMGYGTWKISKSVAANAVYEAIKFAGVSSVILLLNSSGHILCNFIIRYVTLIALVIMAMKSRFNVITS